MDDDDDDDEWCRRPTDLMVIYRVLLKNNHNGDAAWYPILLNYLSWLQSARVDCRCLVVHVFETHRQWAHEATFILPSQSLTSTKTSVSTDNGLAVCGISAKVCGLFLFMSPCISIYIWHLSSSFATTSLSKTVTPSKLRLSMPWQCVKCPQPVSLKIERCHQHVMRGDEDRTNTEIFPTLKHRKIWSTVLQGKIGTKMTSHNSYLFKSSVDY